MNSTVGSRCVVELFLGLCLYVCVCTQTHVQTDMCTYVHECTHRHTHIHPTSSVERTDTHTRVENSRSHSYYKRYPGLHNNATIPEARKEYQFHFMVTTAFT